jgi:hypothetical protein
MRVSKHILILAAIFVLVAAIRIIFASQVQGLGYDAYFSLRQGEHILETGKPIYADSLSYQGRTFYFPPLFQYVVSFFLKFFSADVVVNVIANLFASSIVVVVYLIVENLIEKKSVALICAFFSGFVPAFFSSTFNSLSSLVFVMPLFFLIIYFLLNVNKKGYLFALFGLLFVLALSHAVIYVLIIALIMYLILLKLESFKIQHLELELLLFVTFLVVWINFLIYKKAFLFHGFDIIWQNIPTVMLSSYFKSFSYLEVIFLVGFVPLLLGVFSMYHVLFRQKRKNFLLLIAFAAAFAILLFFRLIPLMVGLAFFSIILIILSSLSLSELLSYFHKTKFSYLRIPLIILLLTFFILTSVFRTFSLSLEVLEDTPTQGDVDALQWLSLNSKEGATVLAPIKEGFFVEYEAHRAVVADKNFLMIADANIRYEDMNEIFSSQFEINAMELLEKYNVEYIFLSERFFDQTNTSLGVFNDERCFERVWDREQKIFKVRCRLT